jgi:hypothetical protein
MRRKQTTPIPAERQQIQTFEAITISIVTNQAVASMPLTPFADELCTTMIAEFARIASLHRILCIHLLDNT